MPTEQNTTSDEWRIPPASYPAWMEERWYSTTLTNVDRLGWVRQMLRWVDLQHGQETVATAYVPTEVATDRSLIDRFGLVRRGVSGVATRAWKPAWLDIVGSASPDDACGVFHRRPNEEVKGDPVLSQMGLSTYRSAGQRGSMRAVLLAPEGSTLLVVLPTGAGKSLLAQLPTLVEDGLTVVVVPTVALALDQDRALRDQRADWGDGPYAYTGGGGANGNARREIIRRRINDGTQRIIFASPEALVGGLKNALWEAARMGYLKRLVIDEAHLVDAWGEDFRPEYQELAGFRLMLLSVAPSLRTVLLSATITESTRKTLTELFSGGGPWGISSGAALRAEPAYWVSAATSETERQKCVMEGVNYLPRPLILYSSTREDADGWYDRLREEGYRRVGLVTGATSPPKRESLVKKWSEGALDIMAATSAFGMGIDQPHVRTVIHATLPESLDRFYQETGRSGRDGCASVSLMVIGPGDVEVARNLADQKYLTPEVGHRRWQRLFQNRRSVEGPDISPNIADSNGDSEAIDSRLVAVDIQVGVGPVMHSRRNVYWNQRTLTMMHRAGLIGIRGPALWVDESLPSANFRLVELSEPRHLDCNEWEYRIGSFRSERRVVVEEGLRELENLLRSECCWSQSLRKYYTLVDTAPPSPACGGCPACRRSIEGQPFALLGPEPIVPWDLTIDMLSQSPHPRALDRFQILCVEVPLGRSLEVEQRMVRAMRALVRCGYRQVVTSEDSYELLPKIQHGLPPILSSLVFDPSLVEVPTVVFFNTPNITSDIVKSGPPIPRVVFIPEGVTDPDVDYRLLRHRVETWSLGRLISELGA